MTLGLELDDFGIFVEEAHHFSMGGVGTGRLEVGDEVIALLGHFERPDTQADGIEICGELVKLGGSGIRRDAVGQEFRLAIKADRWTGRS